MDKIKLPDLGSGESTHTEIPDLVTRHDAVRAEISKLKGEYPPVKNPLNRADSRVEQVRETSPEWNISKPFKLEEFEAEATDYRGQGLLPTDEMKDGYKVKDSAKLKMPQYPAGKTK